MTLSLRVIHGDALGVLRTLTVESIDAVVTDPPAGISFMGKTWDTPGSYGFTDGGNRTGTPPTVNLGRNPTCQACGGRKRAGPATRACSCAVPSFNDAALRLRDREAFVECMTGIMAECLRVLRPGGHALVWAIPRTSHWTATAIEDAGFEIRDVITHHFGSGFPKSLDVSKAIDRAAGAERAVVGPRMAGNGKPVCVSSSAACEASAGKSQTGRTTHNPETAPATPEAARWSGWGTALKPASEHWILARKPLVGTVARNVTEHGTGALNVDGCRIGTADSLNGGAYGGARRDATGPVPFVGRGIGEFKQPPGRWPANLVLSHSEDCGETCAEGCPVAEMDGQSGISKSTGGRIGKKTMGIVAGTPAGRHEKGDPGFGDSGGASRFFYVAKPSRSERNAGLPEGQTNDHPTVKSIALMRWLTRLVTPLGGLVLDPFCGSGTTGCACALEGFEFIGIDQDEHYVELARARIAHHAGQPIVEDAPVEAAVPSGELPPEYEEETETMSNAPTPILRWPGGKRWLVPRIVPWIQAHLTRTRGRYIEPFLGGAAVALAVGRPSSILADACSDLIITYNAVRDRPAAVAWALKIMAEHGIASEDYYRVRDTRPTTQVDVAARFLYLNSLCFNGLYRENAKGDYNVPYGDRTKSPQRMFPTADQLVACAKALKGARLSVSDFRPLVEAAQSGDVVYADPPYVGGFAAYTAAGFSLADHEDLAKLLHEAADRGVTVIATNADDSVVREMYSWACATETSETRSVGGEAASRTKASCLLLTSDPEIVTQEAVA